MIGRFQVMATLQAARAKVLGYTIEEAKSFGLNRAIFYAAAKRRFKNRDQFSKYAPLKIDESEMTEEERKEHKENQHHVTEIGTEKAFYDEHNGCKYFVIGQTEQRPEDFDTQISRRFYGKFDHAWKEALNIIEHTNKDLLLSQNKFFNYVYKPRRDTLAHEWTEMVEKA